MNFHDYFGKKWVFDLILEKIYTLLNTKNAILMITSRIFIISDYVITF